MVVDWEKENWLKEPEVYERYDVFFRSNDGNVWTSTYQARSFAEAEMKAYDGAGSNPDEIIKITKDYEN